MELKKVEAFKKEINFKEPELLSQYGVNVQKNLSQFSEEILMDVKNKQAAEVGSLLNEMILTIKGIDIENLSNPGLITRVWHKILTEVSLFKSSFEKINTQIDFMIQSLEESKQILLSDIKKLDLAYDKNVNYYRDIDALVQAGEEAIHDERKKIDIHYASDDHLEIQSIKDRRDTLIQFEKRIHDLKLTKTMTLQTLPQIRLIQHNNNELVNKIQSSILNTIPIWKNQIVLTLSLEKQKKVAEVQKKILETTNTLLIKNARILKDNTINIARTCEQGSLETKSLETVNEDLITTISTVLQIYQEGRLRRKESEKVLIEMEKRLKVSLLQVV
jgi:uncharacterized protein YaaN involved in tellurite resistance